LDSFSSSGALLCLKLALTWLLSFDWQIITYLIYGQWVVDEKIASGFGALTKRYTAMDIDLLGPSLSALFYKHQKQF